MRIFIIGFALGILWLQQQAELWSWERVIALAVVLALVFWIRTRIKRPILGSGCNVLSGMLTGWLWASGVALLALSQQLSPEIEEQDISLVGVVTSLPSLTEYGQRFQFTIEKVITPDIQQNELPKKVLLSWNSSYSFQRSPSATSNLAQMNQQVKPGERWQFNVRLRRPHGLANLHGFDYEVWLLEQGIGATGTVRNTKDNIVGSYADNKNTSKASSNSRLTPFVFSFNNAVQVVRGLLRDRILSSLPEQPYAPILVALVIGEQNAISANDWTMFARTGVSHLISISGLHVTMLSGMVAQIMFFLWRKSFFTAYQLPLLIPAQKVAALSGVIMALMYVALAGFGVPAQRTLIMLSVVALAIWFDRVSNPSYVLSLALGLVLLVDPWAVLWPGFWLSFGAVGFIFFAGVGRATIRSTSDGRLTASANKHGWAEWRKKIVNYWHEATLTQYVVTLGLVPLTMLLFNQVSLVSPIANAVAIPLVSLVITPCALLGSILPAPIGDWVLIVTNAVLNYLIVFLVWVNQFSWAVWQAPRPSLWMFTLAMIGTFWCLAPKGWPLRWAGMLAWLPLCLNQSEYPRAGEFNVTALDVGQGMALLIETEKHRLLYDTGPSYTPDSDAGSRVIYPYLKMRGISYLDGLMISHNDSDHSGGAISLMRQMKMGWVVSSLVEDSIIVQTAHQLSQHRTCLAGDSWVWDGVQFEILHPPAVIYTSKKWKPNAKSCTIKITQGAHSILLPGDIEAIQEDQLVNSIPDKLVSTVLLAPHHGSGTSSTLPFLRAVNPSIAIFQLGYHNRYKHPKASVWERYADEGIVRYRNDQSGAITLKFGKEVLVEEYRQKEARYWYPKPELID
jgi:competence protein ComEC